MHPEDREPTLAAAKQQSEAGEPVLRFENRYRHQDGSYRWLEWSSRPDEANRKLIAIARDITERKLLEEASERYKEALELVVAERTAELRRRSDELEGARLETLRMLALAVEYRDHQTHEHTERVGHTSALLAELLGEPERNVSLIRQAAPLHDIGKLGVSDAILLQPGKLTPEEFEEVKRHTQRGTELLAGSVSSVPRDSRDPRFRAAGASLPSPMSSTHSPTSGPTREPGRSRKP